MDRQAIALAMTDASKMPYGLGLLEMLLLASGTLTSVAAGASRNLIERVADVVLKEQRKLILVPREMPLSTIHLESMLRLARLGGMIMPPAPGIYHRPRTVQDVVDFVVARILDRLDIEQGLVPPWGAEPNV